MIAVVCATTVILWGSWHPVRSSLPCVPGLPAAFSCARLGQQEIPHHPRLARCRSLVPDFLPPGSAVVWTVFSGQQAFSIGTVACLVQAYEGRYAGYSSARRE